ncbi:MAG: hypothetical protein AAGG50_15765 [Bacteroidota bacterium]
MTRISLLRRCCAGWACALLLTLAACDNPSSAGLDLIGEDGGVPVAVIEPAVVVVPDTLSEVTGGFAAVANPTAARVLAGEARDPLFGTVTTDAFLDFVRPTSVPDGFTESTPSRLVLELPIDYVYGDSAAVTRFDVYEIPADWEPVGARPDTTFIDFATTTPFASFDLGRSDTTATFELPSAWITEKGETLTSDTFESAFHGFVLRASGDGEGYTGPGGVRGFDAPSIRLAVTVADTTIRYAANEVFTRIAWDDAPSRTDDLAVARDGAQESISVEFDYGTNVRQRPLSSAEFRLKLDEMLTDMPVNGVEFVRPRPEALDLFGTNPDAEPGDNPLVRIGRLGYDNELGEYRFSSVALTNAMQDELLGSVQFERFVVRLVSTPAAVSVLPIFGPSLTDQTPRFEFIVTDSN